MRMRAALGIALLSGCAAVVVSDQPDPPPPPAAVVTFQAASPSAPPPPPPTHRLIAVLPLDLNHAKGKVDLDARASLDETLRDVAANALGASGWTVLTGDTMLQVLRDNGVDPTRCGDEECHLASARKLKASTFISGAVESVEGQFTASIRLIETKTGRILAAQMIHGASVLELQKKFQEKAVALFTVGGLLPATGTARPPAVAPPASTYPSMTATMDPVVEAHVALSGDDANNSTGRLTIAAEPVQQARLSLTDPGGRTSNVRVPYVNMSALPGRWTAVASADGYTTASKSFDVRAGEQTVINFALQSTSGTTSMTMTWPGMVISNGTNGPTMTFDLNAIKSRLAGRTRREPKTGLEFVFLPGGAFTWAGCAAETKQCAGQAPGEPATVPAMWMGKTEVTAEAYATCVSAGICTPQGTTSRSCAWPSRADHPVNCVDWDQARTFCEWIGGALPTATEWEYAAKSGEQVRHPWGDDPITGQRANYCDRNCRQAVRDRDLWQRNNWIDDSQDDGYATTAPVGSFPAGKTRWGLLDMAGNVWEWTASYHDGHDSSDREIRGDGWDTGAHGECGRRCSAGADPKARMDDLGFRCRLPTAGERLGTQGQFLQLQQFEQLQQQQQPLLRSLEGNSGTTPP